MQGGDALRIGWQRAGPRFEQLPCAVGIAAKQAGREQTSRSSGLSGGTAAQAARHLPSQGGHFFEHCQRLKANPLTPLQRSAAAQQVNRVAASARPYSPPQCSPSVVPVTNQQVALALTRFGRPAPGRCRRHSRGHSATQPGCQFGGGTPHRGQRRGPPARRRARRCADSCAASTGSDATAQWGGQRRSAQQQSRWGVSARRGERAAASDVAPTRRSTAGCTVGRRLPSAFVRLPSMPTAATACRRGGCERLPPSPDTKVASVPADICHVPPAAVRHHWQLLRAEHWTGCGRLPSSLPLHE